jgi:hypothetical protein
MISAEPVQSALIWYRPVAGRQSGDTDAPLFVTKSTCERLPAPSKRVMLTPRRSMGDGPARIVPSIVIA